MCAAVTVCSRRLVEAGRPGGRAASRDRLRPHTKGGSRTVCATGSTGGGRGCWTGRLRKLAASRDRLQPHPGCGSRTVCATASIDSRRRRRAGRPRGPAAGRDRLQPHVECGSRTVCTTVLWRRWWEGEQRSRWTAGSDRLQPRSERGSRTVCAPETARGRRRRAGALRQRRRSDEGERSGRPTTAQGGGPGSVVVGAAGTAGQAGATDGCWAAGGVAKTLLGLWR